MVGEAPREGSDEDARLDDLIEKSGLVWPASDAQLDGWLARQPLAEDERAWVADVVRRRLDEAARGSGAPAASPAWGPVGDAQAPAKGEPLASTPGPGLAPAPARPTRTPRRLSYDDLALLNGQLLELVEARVPLPRGLEAWARELDGARLAPVLVALRRDVEAGVPLSQALANRPEVPAVYKALVAAGEASGDLGSILALLHEQAQVDADLDRRVREALVYPGLALAMALAGAAASALLVFPRLRELYDSLGIAIPAPTALLVGAVGAVADHPLVALAAAAGLSYALRDAPRRLAARVVRGTAGASRGLATFSRALGGLLERGVPLPAAVRALGEVAPAGASLEAVAARLDAGSRLSDALRDEPSFPRTYTWSIGAAEARGDLPATLLELARRNEREFQRATRLAELAVGPVCLAGVGAFAGLVAVCVFLPLFETQKALQQ